VLGIAFVREMRAKRKRRRRVGDMHFEKAG
jgi:hypothetical protein